ncbi:MAG TPA: hypothetical protein DCE48_16790 [Lachnospiraceae bacterium]|nr:hypothetical protein [Lachnospiraceae bacterium]
MPSPEEIFIQKVSSEQLYKAIKALPPLQGRALSVELRIYENTMPRTVGNFRRYFTMNNNQKQIAPLETEFG